MQIEIVNELVQNIQQDQHHVHPSVLSDRTSGGGVPNDGELVDENLQDGLAYDFQHRYEVVKTKRHTFLRCLICIGRSFASKAGSV